MRTQIPFSNLKLNCRAKDLYKKTLVHLLLRGNDFKTRRIKTSAGGQVTTNSLSAASCYKTNKLLLLLCLLILLNSKESLSPKTNKLLLLLCRLIPLLSLSSSLFASFRSPPPPPSLHSPRSLPYPASNSKESLSLHPFYSPRRILFLLFLYFLLVLLFCPT